jgi:uncharacterized protein (TIGR02996 family)
VNDGGVLLAALHARPDDELAWLAYADCLEENDQAGAAEVPRLLVAIRRQRGRHALARLEQRLRDLLVAGVRPPAPTVVNSLGMVFALVPAGSFLMGSPDDELGRFGDESPLHPVTLTRAFYLGAYPVTQAQFHAVLGLRPSAFAEGGEEAGLVADRDTSSFPVESVTWHDALELARALGELPAERDSGRRYRLPTEAEWEYACRGGVRTPTPYQFGDELLPEQGRHAFRESMQEHILSSSVPYEPCPAPVGSYPPNAYGLFDMHGNVWEWCHDWFNAGYYRDSPATDPTGPSHGDGHVLRGGSWFSRPAVCRTACRNPMANPDTTGFRLLLEQRS